MSKKKHFAALSIGWKCSRFASNQEVQVQASSSSFFASPNPFSWIDRPPSNAAI